MHHLLLLVVPMAKFRRIICRSCSWMGLVAKCFQSGFMQTDNSQVCENFTSCMALISSIKVISPAANFTRDSLNSFS